MAAALEVDIAWDLDNCLPVWPVGHPNHGGVNPTYAIVKNLVYFVRRYFPTATTIRIKAWSNLDPQSVTRQMRNQLSRLAVDVVDSPLGPLVTNEADRIMMREITKRRVMMREIYDFAISHQAPTVVVLISGDGDFYQIMGHLKSLGYTTVQVGRGGHTNLQLRDICHYHFDWEHHVISRVLPIPPPLLLRRVPHLLPMLPTFPWGIFWDIFSCALPLHLHFFLPSHILAYIRQIARAPPDFPNGYEAFGYDGDQNHANQLIKTGVRYFFASANPAEKDVYLDNMMIARILTYAHINRSRPCHIVIMTSNPLLSDLIHFLTRRGHYVTLFLPYGVGVELLQDASGQYFNCPDDWQTVI